MNSVTAQNSIVLQVGKKRYPVASYAEASAKVSAARDASGVGSSRFSPPLVFVGGEQVGYVSYNGRVWPGLPNQWKPDTQPLFG